MISTPSHACFTTSSQDTGSDPDGEEKGDHTVPEKFLHSGFDALSRAEADKDALAAKIHGKGWIVDENENVENGVSHYGHANPPVFDDDDGANLPRGVGSVLASIERNALRESAVNDHDETGMPLVADVDGDDPSEDEPEHVRNARSMLVPSDYLDTDEDGVQWWVKGVVATGYEDVMPQTDVAGVPDPRSPPISYIRAVDAAVDDVLYSPSDADCELWVLLRSFRRHGPRMLNRFFPDFPDANTLLSSKEALANKVQEAAKAMVMYVNPMRLRWNDDMDGVVVAPVPVDVGGSPAWFGKPPGDMEQFLLRSWITSALWQLLFQRFATMPRMHSPPCVAVQRVFHVGSDRHPKEVRLCAFAATHALKLLEMDGGHFWRPVCMPLELNVPHNHVTDPGACGIICDVLCPSDGSGLATERVSVDSSAQSDFYGCSNADFCLGELHSRVACLHDHDMVWHRKNQFAHSSGDQVLTSRYIDVMRRVGLWIDTEEGRKWLDKVKEAFRLGVNKTRIRFPRYLVCIIAHRELLDDPETWLRCIDAEVSIKMRILGCFGFGHVENTGRGMCACEFGRIESHNGCATCRPVLDSFGGATTLFFDSMLPVLEWHSPMPPCVSDTAAGTALNADIHLDSAMQLGAAVLTIGDKAYEGADGKVRACVYCLMRVLLGCVCGFGLDLP